MVKLCREHRVPLIPFGVGSSLEGHILATRGGLSLDMSEMNQVLAIHNEDMDAVVQPGEQGVLAVLLGRRSLAAERAQPCSDLAKPVSAARLASHSRVGTGLAARRQSRSCARARGGDRRHRVRGRHPRRGGQRSREHAHFSRDRSGWLGAAGGAAAVRGGATAAGSASSAYTLGSLGQSGASGVASGLGGVARAVGSAVASPLRHAAARAGESVKSSNADGAKAGFVMTGGASTMGTVGQAPAAGASSAESPAPARGGAPDWAKRMKRHQAVSHGVSAAAHAVRSGDSHGSGSSVNLSESDRS